jgi:hypothetical protein
MDTVNALATFNVLTEEGRVAVAALLPLDPFDPEGHALFFAAPGSAPAPGPTPAPPAAANPSS